MIGGRLASIRDRVARRLRRREGVQWAADAAAVAAMAVLGAGAGLWLRPGASPPPGPATPPALEAGAPLDSAPATSSRPARPAVAAEGAAGPGRAEGWAAGVELPPWVTDPSLRERPRAEPGEAAGRRPSAPGGPRSADVSVEALALRLARRTAGPRATLHAVPFGGGTPVGSRWAVLGDCDRRVRREGGGQATEQGSRGAWLAALVAPLEQCYGARGLAADRSAPSQDRRAALAGATRGSQVVRKLGAPSFEASELSDYATYRTAGGDRYAFGVFRREAATTQISPPPPLPQLAFVAWEESDGRWRILWGRFTASAGERIALAGGLDTDADGLAEPLFVIRRRGGGGRALHVGPTEGEGWGLLDLFRLDGAP